jgi:hypothetical protein
MSQWFPIVQLMYANTNGKGHIEMINKHMKYDPCHYDIRENQRHEKTWI